MDLPIHDIKQTCAKWQVNNGFVNLRFEEVDKNPVCKIIHRLVRSDWDEDILIIQDFDKVELSQEQKKFIDSLCEEHNLIYGRQPNGQHYLASEIDLPGLFSDISKLLNEIK